MKTVKEIKEMRDLWYSSPTKAFEAFTDALIGITERLEAQQIGGVDKHGIRWTCKFVDPNSGPSDVDIEARIARAEARKKKIEEWTEKFQKATCVKMPLEDAIDLPLYTAQVRREGMIAALLWRCDMCPDQGGPLCKGCRTSEALHRLENGGDL